MPQIGENSAPDTDLLNQALSGQPLALERLLVGYQGRLLARISRKLPLALRTTISAEDVMQDTYVEVFRSINSFEPTGMNAFTKWLLLIADNKLVDAIRLRQAAKRGRGWRALEPQAGGSSVTPLLELLQVDSHSPSRSVAGHDIEAAIHVALAGLKDEYREAVRLRFLEGLSIQEVARRMERSEWSVHKLCSRGLKRLREVMGDVSRFMSRA